MTKASFLFVDQMNLKIGSSSEEVDRTSNSSWSVCSNSAHGAIGSISSSTSINIDMSNMTNSPHNQGKNQNECIAKEMYHFNTNRENEYNQQISI